MDHKRFRDKFFLNGDEIMRTMKHNKQVYNIWRRKFYDFDENLINVEDFVDAMLKEEFNEVSTKSISQE